MLKAVINIPTSASLIFKAAIIFGNAGDTVDTPRVEMREMEKTRYSLRSRRMLSFCIIGKPDIEKHAPVSALTWGGPLGKIFFYSFIGCAQ